MVTFDTPRAGIGAPKGAFGGRHGTVEYYLVRDLIDALEAGNRRPLPDAIVATDMTVPGICAHEAAIDEDVRWVDVPLFEW